MQAFEDQVWTFRRARGDLGRIVDVFEASQRSRLYPGCVFCWPLSLVHFIFRLQEQSGRTVQMLDSIEGVLSNEEFLRLRYNTLP